MKRYLDSIDKILLDKKVWILISIFIIFIYLLPLFLPNLYVPVYDNLDSNVVWYKILAESGKIFSSNSEIVPNMMNGLPRASYGSEFDILLWLYSFFGAKTAYIINEIIIHIVAFAGTYLLLSKYIVDKSSKYRDLLIFIIAIYFAIVPFWSGSGITASSIPLTTYVFLELKNGNSKVWHWIYLFVLPFYSSFIMVYLFYLFFLITYIAWDFIKTKQINKPLIFATILLLLLFIFREYRLFLSTFFDKSFISHRVEFDVFFSKDAFVVYRNYILQIFLLGHYPHLHLLQQLYIIPIALTVMVLFFVKKRRFSSKESLMLWILIILPFIINLIFFENLWFPLISSNFTLPVIFLLSTAIYFLSDSKEYKLLSLSMILIIIFATLASLFQYKGLRWFAEMFPIFKSFNITRLYFFIFPILWIVVFVTSLMILLKRVKYSHYFIFLIFLLQIDLSLNESFYQPHQDNKGYLTFEKYFDSKMFQEIKEDIKNSDNRDFKNIKFINYGLEPAVPLFNGFYTVDGYSVNYPLSYKKAFRKVQAKELLDLDLKILAENKRLFDKWGSKLYLLAINSEPKYYGVYSQNKIEPKEVNLIANFNALCDLNTSYILSAYPLKNIDSKKIVFKGKYKGSFWRIWLYKLNCAHKNREIKE